MKQFVDFIMGEDSSSLGGVHQRDSQYLLNHFMDPQNCLYSYCAMKCNDTDNECLMIKGISRISDSVMVEWNSGVTVVADMKRKALLRVEGVELSVGKHNEIVDLSVDGDRWEGDVLDGEPYGWGVLYNAHNERVYEGFRVGEKNSCYGRKYYADIDRIEYEGEWCDGMRWGRGVLYDRTGAVVFSGEWVNGGHFDPLARMTNETELLHNHIEELSIGDGCCNSEKWSVLDLGWISPLRSLTVGDACFGNVDEVRLIGLHALERVVIGRESFTIEKGYIENPDRHFYLKNCPLLKELRIGPYSFSDYSVCEIEDTPSLEVIEMNDLQEWSDNFHYASLELKSILNHRE